MTATLLSTGRQVAVLVAVDHCSAGCVGIHAAIRGTRFEALQPIRQGVRDCFGACATDVAAGLTIRLYREQLAQAGEVKPLFQLLTII